MTHIPKKVNHAGVILPAFLFLIAAAAFGFSYYYPHIVYPAVFQFIAVVFAVLGIKFTSRYAMTEPEYHLYAPSDGHPSGVLTVTMVTGKRRTVVCELDLSLADAIYPVENAKKGRELYGKPTSTMRFSRNLFAPDRYLLFCHGEGGRRFAVSLELQDEIFTAALAEQILSHKDQIDN